jgi:hypothetical protein
MRLVVIESPFAGDIPTNIAYAKAAVRDCLQRGEAPIASHLLFTQEGILRDDVPGERRLGITAGVEWYRVADAVVFYLDRGMSPGMEGSRTYGINVQADRSHTNPTPAIEYRFLMRGAGIDAGERPIWDAAQFQKARDAMIAETPCGRLEVSRSGRPPTDAAPFEVRLAGQTIAFYPTMDQGLVGAELYEQWRRGWVENWNDRDSRL